MIPHPNASAFAPKTAYVCAASTHTKTPFDQKTSPAPIVDPAPAPMTILQQAEIDKKVQAAAPARSGPVTIYHGAGGKTTLVPTKKAVIEAKSPALCSRTFEESE